MPRNVRPSFIHVDVDGRESAIDTGPKSRTGQMSITLYIRNNGQVTKFITIDCLPSRDGKTQNIQLSANNSEITQSWTINQ